MQWEYRFEWVPVRIDEAQKLANDIGEDGWELVTIADRRFVFKRQLNGIHDG